MSSPSGSHTWESVQKPDGIYVLRWIATEVSVCVCLCLCDTQIKLSVLNLFGNLLNIYSNEGGLFSFQMP